MAKIRGDSLVPETLLKAALERRAIKFDTNPTDLPGKPDIAIRDRRLAVFVHGCFWHACAAHYRTPRTRRRFWAKKARDNVRRDARVRRRLNRLGWATTVVWEHSVRLSPEGCAERVERRSKKLPRAKTQ
jgi:DNA mismatch endonuclease (patch repair protein)